MAGAVNHTFTNQIGASERNRRIFHTKELSTITDLASGIIPFCHSSHKTLFPISKPVKTHSEKKPLRIRFGFPGQAWQSWKPRTNQHHGCLRLLQLVHGQN